MPAFHHAAAGRALIDSMSKKIADAKRLTWIPTPGNREIDPERITTEKRVAGEKVNQYTNEGKIANYYNAYLDTDGIDRAGMAPAT